MAIRNLAILISGSGSNMVALAKAAKANRLGGGKIVVVICNVPEAKGVERAAKLGLPVVVIAHRDFPSRATHEAAVHDELRRRKVDALILAGWMRLLTPDFVAKWKHRILNTHPALLPAFPGAHGARDALAWGAKVSGCTIHFVTADMDAGPVILQRTTPILPRDTEATLQKRIQKLEHAAFPEAVKLLCSGKLKVRGRRVMVG